MARSHATVPGWTASPEPYFPDHRHFEELRTEALGRAIEVRGPGANTDGVIETAERFFEFIAGGSPNYCKACQRYI